MIRVLLGQAVLDFLRIMADVWPCGKKSFITIRKNGKHFRMQVFGISFTSLQVVFLSSATIDLVRRCKDFDTMLPRKHIYQACIQIRSNVHIIIIMLLSSPCTYNCQFPLSNTLSVILLDPWLTTTSKQSIRVLLARFRRLLLGSWVENVMLVYE